METVLSAIKMREGAYCEGTEPEEKKTGGRVNGSNKTNDSVFFQGAWDEGRPRFDPTHSKKRGRDAIFLWRPLYLLLASDWSPQGVCLMAG